MQEADNFSSSVTMIFTKAVRLQKPLVEASEVAFGVEAMLVKVAIMG